MESDSQSHNIVHVEQFQQRNGFITAKFRNENWDCLWWLHKTIFRGKNSLIPFILHIFSAMLIQMYFLGYYLIKYPEPSFRIIVSLYWLYVLSDFFIRHVSKLSPLLLIAQTGHFSRRGALSLLQPCAQHPPVLGGSSSY